jgi:hypothetical protein
MTVTTLLERVAHPRRTAIILGHDSAGEQQKNHDNRSHIPHRYNRGINCQNDNSHPHDAPDA